MLVSHHREEVERERDKLRQTSLRHRQAADEAEERRRREPPAATGRTIALSSRHNLAPSSACSARGARPPSARRQAQ